jgi:hypothetical protein
MKVATYLQLADRPPHLELIYGFLRPAPRLHPVCATYIERVRAPLAEHLSLTDRGDLFLPPVDVVLDDTRAIVVRPPLVVVLRERRALLHSPTCIWGPPDILLEVLTTVTARRIRCSKLRWYRMNGVREVWMLDVRHKRFEVLDLHGGTSLPHIYSGRTSVRSTVLPSFCLQVGRLFR